MDKKNEHTTRRHKKNGAGAVSALLLAPVVMAALPGRSVTPAQAGKEKTMTTRQSKFFCNAKALTPEEHAHHQQLTEKLLAARKETVEGAKGYEFRFSPQDVTLAELADWVAAESKCCPFFDFHIDLENEGKLICLRLTGEEGIKQFIRAEFEVQ